MILATAVSRICDRNIGSYGGSYISHGGMVAKSLCASAFYEPWSLLLADAMFTRMHIIIPRGGIYTPIKHAAVFAKEMSCPAS